MITIITFLTFKSLTAFLIKNFEVILNNNSTSFVEEVVVVGQTYRSISCHAGTQLSECFF